MARALPAVYQEDRAIRVIGASLVLAVTGIGASTHSTTDQAKEHLFSVVTTEKSENAILKREVKRLRKSNHDWHRYARKVEREKGRLLHVVADLRSRLARLSPHPVGTRAIGRTMAAARGWVGNEWTALEKLWTAESGWSATARNRSTNACGIPQFVPCRWSVMPSAQVQIAAGLNYIAGRYGRPSSAYAFWLANNWY